MAELLNRLEALKALAVLVAFVAGTAFAFLLFYLLRRVQHEAGSVTEVVPPGAGRVAAPQPQPHRVGAEVVSSNTGRVFVTENILGFWVFTDVTLRDHPKLDTLRTSIRRQITYFRSKISPRTFALLQNIPLWVSPLYEGFPAGGNYHIGTGWLTDQNRPVEMADSVEINLLEHIEEEDRRMPLWLFHELAHGYHFRYMSPEKKHAVLAQFEQAARDGIYIDVPAYDGAGNLSARSSYPANNEYEYFAELSENYIGAGDMRNDIWPFRSDALLDNDRAGYELICSIWAN